VLLFGVLRYSHRLEAFLSLEIKPFNLTLQKYNLMNICIEVCITSCLTRHTEFRLLITFHDEMDFKEKDGFTDTEEPKLIFFLGNSFLS
jgi:hypothetical protein